MVHFRYFYKKILKPMNLQNLKPEIKSIVAQDNLSVDERLLDICRLLEKQCYLLQLGWFLF